MLFGVGCIIAAIFALILFLGKEKEEQGIKIGFIITGSAEESGWNGMHYNGAKEACEKLGTVLLVRENVKEFSGECIQAIRELASEGASMIILSSYGYSEEAKELVKEYPEIAFYVNSSEFHDVNMTSYFSRMYQARYLAGIVAGMKTAGGKIGYVAAMENNEVNRGINAFTLGKSNVSDFSLNRCAEGVRYLNDFTGLFDIGLVVGGRSVEHNRAETKLKGLHAPVKGEAVVIVDYHGNACTLCRGDNRGGDEL